MKKEEKGGKGERRRDVEEEENVSGSGRKIFKKS